MSNDIHRSIMEVVQATIELSLRLSQLEHDTNQGVLQEILLSSTDDVNLNIVTKQTLFLVPLSANCIITQIIVRNASINMDTASFGFGYNALANDVMPSAVHAELTGPTLYTNIYVDEHDAALVGVGGGNLGLKCAIVQGAVATVSVDIFGYFV